MRSVELSRSDGSVPGETKTDLSFAQGKIVSPIRQRQKYACPHMLCATEKFLPNNTVIILTAFPSEGLSGVGASLLKTTPPKNECGYNGFDI